MSCTLTFAPHVLAGGNEASTSDSVAIPPREVIIFFPGMPGCAKSALCKQLLGTDLERPKVSTPPHRATAFSLVLCVLVFALAVGALPWILPLPCIFDNPLAMKTRTVPQERVGVGVHN